MRRTISHLAALLAVLLICCDARAATNTYTWTLVESPTVALFWPNQLGAPNAIESNDGLLGRVMTSTNAGATTACRLAPSYPCASGSPPAFMLPGYPVEGPSNSGGGIECNRKTIACETGYNSIPGAGHGGHPAGNQDAIGEFSFALLQAPLLFFDPSVGFLSGSYTTVQEDYGCNECAPDRAGKDVNDQTALTNTGPTAKIALTDVSLWMTQIAPPAGHWNIRRSPGEPGAGATSACGNGTAYVDLVLDLCWDGIDPGNFVDYDTRVKFKTYSVDTVQHGIRPCDPADCYIENVIVPAALAQNPNAKNVQVLSGNTVLPIGNPTALTNSTLDFLIFAYTTQLIDQDGDGVEDRDDPCPQDPTDFCIADLLGGGNCPAGQAFCVDAGGDFGCIDAFLCNQKLDVNEDCVADGNDTNNLIGAPISGLEAFNTGLPIGPFNP